MQILEGIREGFHVPLLHELLQSDLILRLLLHRVQIVGGHGVEAGVLLHLRIQLLIRHLVSQGCDLADAPVLDLPAVPDLRLKTVSVGHCHIAHVIAEGRDSQISGEADGLRHLSELADLRDDTVVLVVSRNHLVGDAESRKNVAVLSVAVSCLVQVHEIHVDLVVGKLLIRLGVQMQQGLGQDLKALDPHLCG